MPATLTQPMSDNPTPPLSLPVGEMDRDQQWRTVEGHEALIILVETFGAARIGSWLRNIAAQRGESL